MHRRTIFYGSDIMFVFGMVSYMICVIGLLLFLLGMDLDVGKDSGGNEVPN